ncbi:hypothetical protein XENOCAPTIV_021501 [Xenoophorus captivus]|uniref:Solute carrier family 35 member B4 n=1 Tax=Xenoophorus captivus TaxID=1517983 RepID=A0ABV0Q5U3_9TELE
MGTAFAVVLVFVGCCSNVVSLELLDPNPGSFIPPCCGTTIMFQAIALRIAMLTFALLMSARMGIFQETLYKQYVCIRGVFILTTECTSLTVTLVVTLRKFLSLIFSILYFQNPFTAWHWVGTAVVFMGTLLYTEVWSSMQAALPGAKVKAKKAE